MNCWTLILLLLCCQNNGCGTEGTSTNAGCGCGNNCGMGCGSTPSDCGCTTSNSGCRNANSRSDSSDCGCTNNGCRNEFRPEPRIFPTYPGTTCGCEEPQSSSCDCCP